MLVTARYSEGSIFQRFDIPKVSYSRLGLGLGNRSLWNIEPSEYRPITVYAVSRMNSLTVILTVIVRIYSVVPEQCKLAFAVIIDWS